MGPGAGWSAGRPVVASPLFSFPGPEARRSPEGAVGEEKWGVDAGVPGESQPLQTHRASPTETRRPHAPTREPGLTGVRAAPGRGRTPALPGAAGAS